MTTPTRLHRHGLAALLALIAALAFSATPALAARGHVFGSAFGWGVQNGKSELQRCSEGCKPGVPGSGAGQFDEPTAIAVSELKGPQEGDVYVVDKGNNRVEVFNAKGEYQFEFNGSGALLNECNAMHVCAAGSGGSLDEELTGRFSEPEGIAVDNDPSSPSAGDVYVVDLGHDVEEHGEKIPERVIDKYTATGEYVGQITAKTADVPNVEGIYFGGLDGVAVDSHGQVWITEDHHPEGGGLSVEGVDNFTNAEANVHIAFHELASKAGEEFPLGHIVGGLRSGLAVDAKDDLYLNVREFVGGDRIAEFNERAELVVPEVDGAWSTGVAVELPSDDVYVDNFSSVGRFGPEGKSIERLGEGDLPSLPAGGCEHPGLTNKEGEECDTGGVAVDAATGRVYVAAGSANEIVEFVPEPPGPPTVEVGSESVSEVKAESAKFSAEVNPRSEPGEAATSYRFEYITEAAYQDNVGNGVPPFTGAASAPQPEGQLAANYEPDTVTAELLGLAADTVYRYRVSAHNGFDPGDPTVGEERVFTTQAQGSFGLPDEREYELVSPPDKHGAKLYPILEGVIQASASGDAITYLANAPTEAEPVGSSDEVQVLSRRGSDNWESGDITPPHNAATGVPVSHGAEYHFFSEDLSAAVVDPFGPFDPSTSAAASEQTAFLRDNTTGSYAPLVSGCPAEEHTCAPLVKEHADVLEGTVFGVSLKGGECISGLCGPQFVGASPDGKHVVLRSKVPLIAGAPEKSLYEWSEGRLSPVSVLPGSGAWSASDPVLGHADEEGGSEYDKRDTVSEDGSRVVWSEAGGKRGLYLRDMQVEAEETVQIGLSGAVFVTAARNDSRIFYTEGGDLYVFEVTSGAGEALAGKVKRVTEGAEVLGTAIGASEDGSYLYFVGNGVLGDGSEHGAKPGDCGQTSVAGESCNLYVAHDQGGVWTTSYIAALSGADGPDWGGTVAEQAQLAKLTARVSPNGQWLAFMSQESLTGYNNEDVGSKKRGERPDEEVYLYNAGSGRLACASCNPSGARPAGVDATRAEGEGALVLGFDVYTQGQWVAANVPAWTPYELESALYQSRYLSNEGRLFFNSDDGLVSEDGNGTWDVYEYEPEGVGDCSSGSTSGSVVFKPARSVQVEGQPVSEGAGCVGLISSGTSADESAFLDASESGDDVFFLTASKLVSEDTDSVLDVYDAHVCSSGSPCFPPAPPPPPSCEGDACQSSVGAPDDATPGSLTYQGPGNLAPLGPAATPKKTAAQVRAEKLSKALKACRKDHAEAKRVKCEKAARKRYGAAKASKAKPKKKG